MFAAYNKILKDVSGELQVVIDSAHNAIGSVDKDGLIPYF